MIGIRLARLIRRTEGSITLEAALILPLILVLSLSFVFMGLYFLEKTSAYGIASSMAERASFLWDNSYRSAWTGAYPSGKHDGLYWRIREDNVGNLVQNDLPERKMARISSLVPDRWDSNMGYSNLLIKRTVSAEAQSTLHGAWFTSFLKRSRTIGHSASTVVDPVELIRSVRMLELYVPQWKESGSGGPAPPILEQGQETPEKPTPAQRLEFRRETEARSYMQRQTGGKETSSKLEDGRRRKIDGLDADGIAHQAYIGYVPNRFTRTEDGEKVNEQLDKDLILIRSGQVKAVVWHFYRKIGEERVGPSRPLLRELDRQGIIVIIHDQEYPEVDPQ